MEKIDLIDYLKAIATFFVIITHCSITIVYKQMFLWPFIIDMAVPIFMLLSGFNTVASMERRNISSYRQWFGFKNLYPRFVRILVPFIAIATITILYAGIFVEPTGNFMALISLTFNWGLGPGAYYIPILVQLIVISPFLYFIMKKNKAIGFCILIALNFIFEIFVQVLPMDENLYRICIFRYLGIFAFGMLIYYNREKVKVNLLLFCFAIGVTFIALVNYLGYEPIMFNQWTVTSLPTYFYIAPVIWVAFLLFQKKKINSGFGSLLSLIGKASYHIFLVQMVYYYLDFGFWVNDLISIAVNVIICITLGIVFYKLESKATKKIFRL